MTNQHKMKDKFALNNVTIVIDQTESEREKTGIILEWYYLRATNENSPLQCYGTPEEIGEWFGEMLTKTIAAMQKNDCKTIKMKLEWE